MAGKSPIKTFTELPMSDLLEHPGVPLKRPLTELLVEISQTITAENPCGSSSKHRRHQKEYHSQSGYSYQQTIYLFLCVFHCVFFLFTGDFAYATAASVMVGGSWPEPVENHDYPQVSVRPCTKETFAESRRRPVRFI